MTKTGLATPEDPDERPHSAPGVIFQPPADPARSKPSRPAEGRKPRKSRGKRGNGEGSIWPRKDGRYGFAAYVLTTAGTYKRVQGYARSHEDARKKLTELLRQADQGIPVASESWTVEQYLTYWLEHVVRVERRPKTVQGYEGVVGSISSPAWVRSGSASSPPGMCGSSSPVCGSPASAANTDGMRLVKSPAAVQSRAGSAARPGCRSVWCSPFTQF
jgi:hypothetical protein